MRFLGLDIGSTRMKLGVFGEDGIIQYEANVDYGETIREKEKYVDILKLKSSALALLKDAYEKCPFNSITVASLGESFVLLNEKDEVLFYPMLYTDNRGEEQADEQTSNAQKIFQIAGVYPQGMYSAYKLKWIKDNYPEVYKKAKKLMLVNEYVTYLLTGVRAIDYSQCARTGVFDIREKEFSVELCQLLDIERELFSPCVESGSIIGNVKSEILQEWGAKNSVTVVAGGHDQVMATLGSGAIKKGDCSDGMGTVECVTAIFDEPSIDDEMGKKGYPIVPFLDRYYCTYLLNYSCGSLTRWWLSTCFSDEEIKSGKAFENIEQDFVDEPTGLLVLPYFAGAATPYQDINAKGAILNLSLSDGRSRVYQGVLEGLCYEIKLNIETTKKFGVYPKKLIVTGGGAASKKWLQIKADILDLPIYPLITKESGVCGCAILGAVALLNESLEAVIKKFVRYGEPIMPRNEGKNLYSENFSKYEKLYKVIKEFC